MTKQPDPPTTLSSTCTCEPFKSDMPNHMGGWMRSETCPVHSLSLVTASMIAIDEQIHTVGSKINVCLKDIEGALDWVGCLDERVSDTMEQAEDKARDAIETIREILNVKA